MAVTVLHVPSSLGSGYVGHPVGKGSTSNSPAISVDVVTVRFTTCSTSSSYGPGRMSKTAGATWFRV